MNLLTAVAIFAFLFTIIALGLGIASMAHGGEADQKNSTQLMTARVLFQAVALAAILLAFALGVGVGFR